MDERAAFSVAPRPPPPPPPPAGSRQAVKQADTGAHAGTRRQAGTRAGRQAGRQGKGKGKDRCLNWTYWEPLTMNYLKWKNICWTDQNLLDNFNRRQLLLDNSVEDRIMERANRTFEFIIFVGQFMSRICWTILIDDEFCWTIFEDKIMKRHAEGKQILQIYSLCWTICSFRWTISQNCPTNYWAFCR